MLEESERKRKVSTLPHSLSLWRVEGGLYRPVTLCSPGRAARELLYPPTTPTPSN